MNNFYTSDRKTKKPTEKWAKIIAVSPRGKRRA